MMKMRAREERRTAKGMRKERREQTVSRGGSLQETSSFRWGTWTALQRRPSRQPCTRATMKTRTKQVRAFEWSSSALHLLKQLAPMLCAHVVDVTMKKLERWPPWVDCW